MKKKIPVSAAAWRLRISYQRALRLVMIGTLDGERDGGGRWFVDESSIDKYIAQAEARQRPDGPARSSTAA